MTSDPAVRAERYGQSLFSTEAHTTEVQRLTALAAALDGRTWHNLTRLPLPDTARCLDLGTGLATIATRLAARFPDGHVTAADRDTQHTPTTAPPNMTVVRHDVTQDDFPAASFDLIHARWLFSHLPARDQQLQRVARWLKPGGWLVIEDESDFPFDSSPHEQFRTVSQAMCAAVTRHIGTSYTWARTFPDPLRNLGLVNLGLDVNTPVIGNGSPLARFWALSVEQIADTVGPDTGIDRDALRALTEHVESDAFTDVGLASITAFGQVP